MAGTAVTGIIQQFRDVKGSKAMADKLMFIPNDDTISVD